MLKQIYVCLRGLLVGSLVLVASTAPVRAQSFEERVQPDSGVAKGTMLLSVERAFGVTFASSEEADEKIDLTTVQLGTSYPNAVSGITRLAFDYMVSDTVGIGLGGGFLKSSNKSTSDGNSSSRSISVFLVNPRVSVAVPMSSKVVFLFKGGFIYADVTNGGDESSVSRTYSFVVVEPTAAFLVTQGFALTAGLFADYPISTSSSNVDSSKPADVTALGATFGLTGVF